MILIVFIFFCCVKKEDYNLGYDGVGRMDKRLLVSIMGFDDNRDKNSLKKKMW
jgi:hypothetical protein